MSAWLRNYYNGAALSGGFAFPAGYVPANPGSSNLKTIGQNVWAAISGKLSSSKLASMALTEQKLGGPDRFYEILGYLACMDSTGLQIDKAKAMYNKAQAKYKAGKATQTDIDNMQAATSTITSLRASLDALDDVIPSDDVVGKSALSKMKKILHPPTRINKIQRAYLMSTIDPYMPNSALRFVGMPRSAAQIKTMMGRLKGHEGKITDGMWKYKLLRDQIKGKKSTYRQTPWTASVPAGIIRPETYMQKLRNMITAAPAPVIRQQAPVLVQLEDGNYVRGSPVLQTPEGATILTSVPNTPATGEVRSPTQTLEELQEATGSM